MGFMDRVKKAAEGAQAATSKVGIGASGDQMALANKAKRLMDVGVDTPAHIDSMEPTGNTDTPGGAENNITATVKPPGGEAYEWAEVGRKVCESVAGGQAETGVLFCWTGTGASIAANKVAGVRAALCTDRQTAEGARKWNDANVLVMGLRLTSPTVASEMLDAWFVTQPDPSEAANVARLEN